VHRIPHPDLHPRFHVRAVANWINDPNGPIHTGGAYHLFFQRNPTSTDWGPPCWGHAISHDLVRWKVVEDALLPTPGHLDRGGCWSGCAVEHDGRVHAFYTGIDGDDSRQVVCAAESDGDLTTWQKVAEPMIAAPPPGCATAGFRDPYVFAHGDRWLCVVGAGITGERGQVLLYESTDLRQWSYVGPMYERDCHSRAPLPTGEMWECPFLVELDGQHLLGLSVYGKEVTQSVVYVVGEFDGRRFSPREAEASTEGHAATSVATPQGRRAQVHPTMGRLDHGPAFYAPTGTWAPDGRYLLWGWSWELLTTAARRESGVAGCLTVPRELSLVAGTPRMKPARELAALRGDQVADFAGALRSGEEVRLAADTGPAFDVELELHVGDDARLELDFYAAPDGSERTALFLDRPTRQAGIDASRSTLATGDVTDGSAVLPWSVAGDEPVRIRVLVDGSVVEAFLDGHPLTTRIYPTRVDSRGLLIRSLGGVCRVGRVHAWSVPEPAVDFTANS
jgi:beta-fructofuranosidase